MKAKSRIPWLAWLIVAALVLAGLGMTGCGGGGGDDDDDADVEATGGTSETGGGSSSSGGGTPGTGGGTSDTGGGTSGAGGTAPSVAGRWVGNFGGGAAQGQIDMRILQWNSQVSATADVMFRGDPSFTSYSANARSGIIRGDEMTLTLRLDVSGAIMALTGNLSADAKTWSGTFRATFGAGTFTMRKD